MTKTTNIPKGYKDSPLGLIPEDWEVKRLGEVCEINKSSLNSSTDEKYIFNYISLSDVDEVNSRINKTTQVFKTAPSRARRIVNKGDILLSTVRPNLQGFAIIREDVNDLIASTGFSIISATKCYNEFIYYNLFSNSFSKQFYQLIVGTNYPAINSSDVFNLKVALPPLPEQQKIAEILSTWDIAIEKQNELIRQLELRKRGLMQQLLTGKKRIKGFNKEWKKYKLQDIGTTYNGLKGKNKNNFGFGKPYISYLNVFNNTITDTSSFDYVDVKEHENQNKVQFGDIFFTVSSETPHEVGMTSVLLEKLRDTYLNSFCFGFRLNDFSIINPYFIGYYLRNKDFRKKIFKLSQGATRYNLSKKSVLKISITIPTLPEQTAIAEVLTNSDKEIELEKQKLSALQSQKKGLIQVLLSGKIRVTI
jgi:type I restriction enzyme S subunit